MPGSIYLNLFLIKWSRVQNGFYARTKSLCYLLFLLLQQSFHRHRFCEGADILRVFFARYLHVDRLVSPVMSVCLSYENWLTFPRFLVFIRRRRCAVNRLLMVSVEQSSDDAGIFRYLPKLWMHLSWAWKNCVNSVTNVILEAEDVPFSTKTR